VSYLLRLVLPDRPGILGAVATALGHAGIDIVSLDVLERSGGVAVDDIVVKLPAAEVPRVFHGGWSVVLEADGDSWHVSAASEAAPSFEGLTLPWMPLSGPRLLPSEDDWLPERWREMAIEMMAAPYGGPGCAVVLGRSGGPAFRRSELLRLAHLAGIASTVVVLPPA
jgi:hypothetical protein